MSDSIGAKLRKSEENCKKLALYARQLEAQNKKLKDAIEKQNEGIKKYLEERDEELKEAQVYLLDWACDIAVLANHRAFGYGETRNKRFEEEYNNVATFLAKFILADAKEDKTAEYSLSKIDDELKEARGKYFVERDKRKPGRRLKPIDLS